MATLGQRALEAGREAARGTLEAAALDLAGRAAADAPVETGRLRASVSPGGDPAYGGTVEPVDEKLGDRMEVHVTFSTPYAAAQHEGYIDYGEGREVHVREHLRRLPSGKVVRVRAHTQTRRGRVVFTRHPLGGGKKYLENNLKAMAGRYEAVLAANVAEALKRVGAAS
jgi:hypothetical protein